MKTEAMTVNGWNVTVHSVNTLIIGAGAAGLKCALMLAANGVQDVAVAVDKLGNGTSSNSGSDKQTYYKMAVFGDAADSPMDFAHSLFDGGMMHGDLAYIEALGSLPAFFELCRIGVPFPHNPFGAFVGYKTDHDPRQRATSAGPKTSHFMFQKLLAEVRRTPVAILDEHEAVALLTSDDGSSVIGALCLDRRALDQTRPGGEICGLTLFNATNVVLATGGPGELYKTSVWPHGQLGSHGLALAVGARANNLTELQFGLASVAFRWNLSGTYQQVIPDYFSTDSDGVSNPRHFLHDYFSDMPHLATAIFLKGYQWPFHAARTQDGGSSLIDIAVHNEIAHGRRVFMDFMHNPMEAKDMTPFSIDTLLPEARDYLLKSGATQPTPYLRLSHMNQPSIDIYAEHGIDLTQPLEIAVCAQHCNGGLTCDSWWESNVRHLFPIGEVCGTHGVRPGGSALNATQVGATRAALRIAHVYNQKPIAASDFLKAASPQCRKTFEFMEKCLDNAPAQRRDNDAVRREIQTRMTDNAAFLRSQKAIEKALLDAQALCRDIAHSAIACSSPRQLPKAFENSLLALTSVAFLKAMSDYIRLGGGSRGAAMVLDDNGPLTVSSKRGLELPHRPENIALRKTILEVQLVPGTSCDFRLLKTPVRPLPKDDSWFENTWNDWTSGKTWN